MQKIPTVFERDWDGDRSRVLDIITPGCEWVFAGEGTPRRKYDGTCCSIRGGLLFKRREARNGNAPAGSVFIGEDENTGKRVWWTPVTLGPEDAKHRDAFARTPNLPDGTYELVGPSINKNPEGFFEDTLVAHINAEAIPAFPRDFEGMRQYLYGNDIEGVVFHHPDGRMAKIKGKDLGAKRGQTMAVLEGSRSV